MGGGGGRVSANHNMQRLCKDVQGICREFARKVQIMYKHCSKCAICDFKDVIPFLTIPSRIYCIILIV